MILTEAIRLLVHWVLINYWLLELRIWPFGLSWSYMRQSLSYISYLRQLIPHERRGDHLAVKVRLMLLLLSLLDSSWDWSWDLGVLSLSSKTGQGGGGKAEYGAGWPEAKVIISRCTTSPLLMHPRFLWGTARTKEQKGRSLFRCKSTVLTTLTSFNIRSLDVPCRSCTSSSIRLFQNCADWVKRWNLEAVEPFDVHPCCCPPSHTHSSTHFSQMWPDPKKRVRTITTILVVNIFVAIFAKILDTLTYVTIPSL